MSGISGGRGRHAASHAKPGKLTVTKTKVTTTAAVTGAIAFAGGVAEAVHVRSGQLHQQAQAEAAPTTAAARALATANDQIISQLLQQRGAAAGAVNRDLNRGLQNVVGDSGPTAATTTFAPTLTVSTSPTPLSVAPLTAPGTAATLAGVTPTSGVPTTLPSTAPSSTGTPSATPTSTPTSTPTPSSTPTAPKPTATSAKPSAKPSTTATSHPAGWDATPAEARALAESMVPASQWACFDNIITRESSWNVHAVNPSSGAYGLPQALPGDKMASVSSDWANNAVTQIKWAINYMDGRYGSPCAAWSFWQAHNWY